jgi:hypothetical protein
MFEAKAPKNTIRNVRWLSAARAVPERAGTGESPSTIASSISSMEITPLGSPDPVPGASLSTGSAGTAPSYGTA